MKSDLQQGVVVLYRTVPTAVSDLRIFALMSEKSPSQAGTANQPTLKHRDESDTATTSSHDMVSEKAEKDHSYADPEAQLVGNQLPFNPM